MNITFSDALAQMTNYVKFMKKIMSKKKKKQKNLMILELSVYQRIGVQ